MGRAAKLFSVSATHEVAMLVDVSDCIGCKACEIACKEWNQCKAETPAFTGSYQSHPNLSAYTWTVVKFRESLKSTGDVNWTFQKYSCMHCTEAECVEECPTGALYHEANGVVNLDVSKCIGCGECAEECPYDCVHLDARVPKASRKAGKCTFCYDRITNGLNPACVQACPTDCIKYGNRTQLIRWGNDRVSALKRRGFPNATLYGVNQEDGLHNLYVLTDSTSQFRMRSESGMLPKRALLSRWLRPSGKALFGAAVFGMLAKLFVDRRDESGPGALSRTSSAPLEPPCSRRN